MNFEFQILGNGECDRFNDNIDVIITLENGRRFRGTFVTLSNIETIMDRYQSSGECAGGLFFWCVSMIIIRDLSDGSIRASIEELLRTGELGSALSPV